MQTDEFLNSFSHAPVILDGATGSNLQKAGMPRGCCTEKWVLDHPDAIRELQSAYAEAGSMILYAPTFQAQPIALRREGLDGETEKINARLVALCRESAGNALVAGDLTTLAAYLDSWDEACFDQMVENYRRQIRGLMDGGADLLVAETLMYPTEAEAILTAAGLENAPACMCSFTMQPDGSLFSGRDGVPVLEELENYGAAAVGFNCVAADDRTAGLVSRIRRAVKCPVLCKPNGGVPVIGEDGIPRYSMTPEEFAAVIRDCREAGAGLLGGCCGTTPAHIAAVRAMLFS